MLPKFTHLFSVFALLSLLPASYAHAIASPPLGVNGTPTRSDVKRPSNNQPCGPGVNIASSLDTSTAVPADANVDVKVTVTNFNGGPDGSTKVTAKVDPSGTGKNFVQMTVLANGDPAPKNAGSQNVVAQLPAGTQCTGGSQKNKCLVQFVTSSGFGNCVVVSQVSDAAKSASTSSNVRAASPSVVPEKKADGKTDGKKQNDGKKKKGGKMMNDDKNGGKAKMAAKAPADKKDVKAGKKQDKGMKKVAATKKHAKNDEVKGEHKGMMKDAKDGKKNKNMDEKKSDSGKGKGGKKGTKPKAMDGSKQAGTRYARAVLANLDHDAREPDVVDEVDNVAE
jgi:hypothetical protein